MCKNNKTNPEAPVQAAQAAPAAQPPARFADIVSEHYFTAADAVRCKDGEELPSALSMLTFCVMVSRSGFVFTGESACADPANYDEAIANRLARYRAETKVWAAMEFENKQRVLTAQPTRNRE